MEKLTQETSPNLEDLFAEIRQHRTILQGMAVHLQSLEGKNYELATQLSELVDWLTQMTQTQEEKEASDEAGSSTVPETGRSE